MHWLILEAIEKCTDSKKNTFPVRKPTAHQDRIQRGAQMSMDEESERPSIWLARFYFSCMTGPLKLIMLQADLEIAVTLLLHFTCPEIIHLEHIL